MAIFANVDMLRRVSRVQPHPPYSARSAIACGRDRRHGHAPCSPRAGWSHPRAG